MEDKERERMLNPTEWPILREFPCCPIKDKAEKKREKEYQRILNQKIMQKFDNFACKQTQMNEKKENVVLPH